MSDGGSEVGRKMLNSGQLALICTSVLISRKAHDDPRHPALEAQLRYLLERLPGELSIIDPPMLVLLRARAGEYLEQLGQVTTARDGEADFGRVNDAQIGLLFEAYRCLEAVNHSLMRTFSI